jgi:O-succinylbenzoate synthase
MLETGIGRAANLALASRTGFSLPGDISASDRYYEEDICQPEFQLMGGSEIRVPDSPGLGIEVNMDLLENVTLARVVLEPE